MKLKNLLFLFIITLFLSHSCSVYKKEQIKGSGTIDEARINAIIDFSRKHYKRDSTFFIYNCSNKNKNIYCLGFVLSNNKESIDTLFKIGEYNRYFPNDFIEYNNKLFVWIDENKVYNKETVEALHRFNKLDSIKYRIQRGEIYYNQYLSEFVIDHSLKTVYYFICKNQISKYKTVKSQWILEPNDFPIVKCD